MFKKLLSVAAAMLTGLSLCLFVGCDDIDYLNDYDKGDMLEGVTEKTTGKLYTLEEAYEIGYLSQTDLKKISYFHNTDNAATYPVELFDNVKEAIKRTCAAEWNADNSNTAQATADDFSIERFHGYYYKCCVVSIDSTMWGNPGVTVDDWKTIGGVKFHFTDHDLLRVWMREEDFYTLWEAYRFGWLTQDDLKSIAYYNHNRSGNEDIMDKDYTPMPKTPEELDDETKLKIIQAYYKWYLPEKDLPSVAPADFYPYFGCYHNCVVIKLNRFPHITAEPGIEIKYTVGGVEFCESYSMGLFVWKQAA